MQEHFLNAKTGPVLARALDIAFDPGDRTMA